MNEDRILEMFFEKARWQYAIEKGLFKDMNKAVMYQLTTPEARLAMYQRIKSGNYKIMPPHTAKIPKDNGDFRTVYVNEPVDRILLSIANDLLFELKCIPQPYRSTDKLDDFGNAVIKNLTEDECHLTTYMVPAYMQYIDDEREGDAKLLISFSIYEDEATISFHWNVPKN